MAFRMISRSVLLVVALAPVALAQPVLNKITPATASGAAQVQVTLTGTGFSAAPASLVFSPPGMLVATGLTVVNDTTLTATVTVGDDATGQVNVSVRTPKGVSAAVTFDTGRIASGSSTNCPVAGDSTKPSCSTLRWEVDADAATGSGTATDKTTGANILFKLDYQVKSPQAGNEKNAQGAKTAGVSPAANKTLGQATVAHLIFKTGITQAAVADKIQPAATSSSTATAGACPGATASSAAASTGSSSSAPATCTTIASQRAFVVEAGGTFGWAIMRDAFGTFAEAGIAARGSFQALIPANQVIQSAGISYIDLSANNLRDAVGLYEVTGRFRLAQWHDSNSYNADSGKFSKNVDDFLVIEVGYQNNSGLQHLIVGSPQTNTRNRLVGRFYAYPEVSSTNHTKVLFGIEYNGGMNGGPRDLRLFYGVNVDPAKLVHPDPKTP